MLINGSLNVDLNHPSRKLLLFLSRYPIKQLPVELTLNKAHINLDDLTKILICTFVSLVFYVLYVILSIICIIC